MPAEQSVELLKRRDVGRLAGRDIALYTDIGLDNVLGSATSASGKNSVN